MVDKKETNWRATAFLSFFLERRIENGEKLTEEHIKYLRELIADGADINWTGTKNEPIFSYHKTYIMKYVENDDVDSIRALAELGADVNARHDWCKRSALMHAIEYGHYEAARVLAELGADVNARDSDGCSARMIAHPDHQPKVIKMLAEFGADFNSTDNYGRTDCMWAANHGETETVRALAEAGADVNIKCTRPEYWATNHGNAWTACMFAAKEGRTDTIKELAKFGADLDAQDEQGMTACMIAAYWSDRDELYICPFSGPMHARHSDQMGTVIALAELGANIYVKDKEGRTVLDYIKDVKTKQAIVAAHQRYLKKTRGKSGLEEILSLTAKASALHKASAPLRKKHAKEVAKAIAVGKALSKEQVQAMRDKEGRARAKVYKTLLEKRFGKLSNK